MGSPPPDDADGDDAADAVAEELTEYLEDVQDYVEHHVKPQLEADDDATPADTEEPEFRTPPEPRDGAP